MPKVNNTTEGWSVEKRNDTVRGRILHAFTKFHAPPIAPIGRSGRDELSRAREQPGTLRDEIATDESEQPLEVLGRLANAAPATDAARHCDNCGAGRQPGPQLLGS